MVEARYKAGMNSAQRIALNVAHNIISSQYSLLSQHCLILVLPGENTPCWYPTSPICHSATLCRSSFSPFPRQHSCVQWSCVHLEACTDQEAFLTLRCVLHWCSGDLWDPQLVGGEVDLNLPSACTKYTEPVRWQQMMLWVIPLMPTSYDSPVLWRCSHSAAVGRSLRQLRSVSKQPWTVQKFFLPMKKPREKRKYSWIFLWQLSNAFRLRVLAYWKNELLNLTNTGIGKRISMISVRIFNKPASWSMNACLAIWSIFTERDQLDLGLATVPGVGNDLPVELQRSAFGKGHDLHCHVAACKNNEKGYQGDLLPWKVVDQMPIEIKEH